MVLLLCDRDLFAGDHLWWQTQSMARLLDYSFEWILPGHGNWLHRPADQMRAALRQLVQQMERQA